ncbi:MAG: phosphate ABC transporter, permease protein PstA [Deltaproteobacteria bacterium GWA2_38_16]|nr:MAG: phosphate ABC transporter, permease protein PstA [Deltaproteobacteria bacterium GWA2_38_16]OGQ03661.1 MAG: phosphate ABC transporter, permease protein PstA [Deltaproteobacteria bacterium RIFCSPHIGHO2_02_FULL_38_15]OGQ30534.1 MAG: phosphate ABC transporter, permease protein PstA [Deltaproteobacteria bacterium RIFCSPLOWO2_01_FULL_38_9]OGQ62837.1 MAG: phosphate ABC transporter, permease protein PstA [Deltaproteobacteria bacterium RIFCSPLOWO2_12_FULL_38_8]HBQ21817.1 phosphate ABC transporte
MSLAALVRRNKQYDFWFSVISIMCVLFSLLALTTLLLDLALEGIPRLSLNFLISFPSRFADKAGILSAWVGTFWVMFITAFISIPLGILSGLYLEEYAPKNKLTQFIEINISNLSAVPSIIFGLMALGIFVHSLHLGQSLLTAGLTLSLLILPIIIVATREAVRAIPTSIREASYALGATQWQTVKHHILPYSFGGIATGVIIALSRAIGETAPLITVGALTFIAFLPHSFMDPFTVLPIQLFNWISRPQAEFHVNAAGAGVILLTLTLLMNAVAIIIRYRVRKKITW